MAPRGRIYLETTVVSYLAARPSRDLRVAAHQQATSEWWTRRRGDFDLFASQLVVEEASAGDEEAASRRLEYLKDVPLLDLTDQSLALAEKLLTDAVVPTEAEQDALHIAVAAVHGMDYLLTWNCRHIANATMRGQIERACVEVGCDAPVICTPEELLED
jgi:hypothetical protein